MTRLRGAGVRFLALSTVFAFVGAGCASPQATSNTPTESPTQVSTPTEVAEASTTIELTDGHLTFEVPESWDIQIEDMTETIIADGSTPEFNGHTAQQATVTNPDETVVIDAFTNIPWPDIAAIDPDELEVLHAEPLEIGYSYGGEGIWLRTVIGENPAFGEARPSFGMYDGRFEEEQYILVVAPYVSKPDLGAPDEVGGGMTAFITPFSESTAGDWWDEIITIAAGTINQTAAEELTGLEGLEAMHALVDTEEYEQLFDVISSVEVHVRQ